MHNVTVCPERRPVCASFSIQANLVGMALVVHAIAIHVLMRTYYSVVNIPILHCLRA